MRRTVFLFMGVCEHSWLVSLTHKCRAGLGRPTLGFALRIGEPACAPERWGSGVGCPEAQRRMLRRSLGSGEDGDAFGLCRELGEQLVLWLRRDVVADVQAELREIQLADVLAVATLFENQEALLARVVL